jgi:hypothetical protein
MLYELETIERSGVLETLRKAACGFFGAQTHHMRLLFFFALVVKRGHLRVPVMLQSKKRIFPRVALKAACGFCATSLFKTPELQFAKH